MLGTDKAMCRNACQAIVWFREYDLLPTLLVAAEDRSHPNVELAAKTVIQLAELLSAACSAPPSMTDRRDVQLIRRRLGGLLDSSVSRFVKHGRREMITAFLLLSQRDNVVLKQILLDPHHPAYLVLIDDLLHHPHHAIARLLLGFLDDPRAPSSAISVLMRRADLPFVRGMPRKIGSAPSTGAAANLKRLDSIGWLRQDSSLIDGLNDAEQHSLVQLIMASSMKRLEAFKTIDYLIRYGKQGGRVAAASVLAQFGGSEANALAMWALEHGDPATQAAIVPQLRQRGIPGALNRLVEQLDGPNEPIRQAARQALSEFSVERFLAAYDMLDEEVRRTTGVLVRKIDAATVTTLSEELKSPSRTRRLRALGAASAARSVEPLEPLILRLLVDGDHIVRGEAARALGVCDTPGSRQALARRCWIGAFRCKRRPSAACGSWAWALGPRIPRSRRHERRLEILAAGRPESVPRHGIRVPREASALRRNRHPAVDSAGDRVLRHGRPAVGAVGPQRQESALQQPSRVVPLAVPRASLGSLGPAAAVATGPGARTRGAGPFVPRAVAVSARAAAGNLGGQAARDRGPVESAVFADQRRRIGAVG